MEAQVQTEPPPSKTSALLQQQLCEAALYVSGRPLDLKTIGSVIGARSEEKIRSMARAIAERYAKIDSPIQVLELPDGRFVMQLRPEFVKNVRKLSNRPLLTPGPLRTLSFIALRQPISQSHVVRVRGKLAYQHVKQLKEMDLISYDKDKLGRSRVLRTTITFADYFNLNHDPVLMKKELKNVLDLTNQPQAQTTEAADSAEESAS
jgi:segregation and condensation protein B